MSVGGSTYAVRFDASLFTSEHWDDPEQSLPPVIVYTPAAALQNLEKCLAFDSQGIQAIKVPNDNRVDAGVSTPVARALVPPIPGRKHDASVEVSGRTASSLTTVPTDHGSLLFPSYSEIETLVALASDPVYVDAVVTPSLSDANSPVTLFSTSASISATEVATPASSPGTKQHDHCLSLSTGLNNDNFLSDDSSGSDLNSVTMTSARISSSDLEFSLIACVPPINTPTTSSLSGASADLLPSTETLLAELLDGFEKSSISDELRSGISAISSTSEHDHSTGLYNDLEMWISKSMVPETSRNSRTKSSAPPLLAVQRLKDEPHSPDSPNWANAPLAPVRSYGPRRTADHVQPLNSHIEDKYIGMANSSAVAYDQRSLSFVESDKVTTRNDVDATLPNDMHRRPTSQLVSPNASGPKGSYSPPRFYLSASEVDSTQTRASVPGRIRREIELKRGNPGLTPIALAPEGVQLPPPSGNLEQGLKKTPLPTAVVWQEIMAVTSDLDITADAGAQNGFHQDFSIIPSLSPKFKSQSPVGLGRCDGFPGWQRQHHGHSQQDSNQERVAYDYSKSNHINRPLYRHSSTPRPPVPSQDLHRRFAFHDEDNLHSGWIALAELVAQRGTAIADVQNSPSQHHGLTQDLRNFNIPFHDKWTHDDCDDHWRTLHDGGGTGVEQGEHTDASNVSSSGRYTGSRGLHGKTQLRKEYDEQRPTNLMLNGTAQSRWAGVKSTPGALHPSAMPSNPQKERPIEQNVADGPIQNKRLLAPFNSFSYLQGPTQPRWVPEWL